MTREELIEKISVELKHASVTGMAVEQAAKNALTVIVEWLEGEVTQANELINNPHRNQDFTTNIGLAATAREIRRLIAMLKEPAK